MGNSFTCYDLTVTPSGRIIAEKTADFVDGSDASYYVKNRTPKTHLNALLVSPDGKVSIHSEHP